MKFRSTLANLVVGSAVAFGNCNYSEASVTQFPGNGHYYELVNEAKSWQDAKQDSENRSFNNFQGYLSTITSSEENNFIVNNFLPNTNAWLGGYQVPGSQEPDQGWRWVTNEPFSYTNWGVPGQAEPNNDHLELGGEDFLEIKGIFSPFQYSWNDVNSLPSSDRLYVVEYESPEPSTLALIGLGAGSLLRRRKN